MVVLLALSNMAELICSRKYKNIIDDIGSHCSSGWPRTFHLLQFWEYRCEQQC